MHTTQPRPTHTLEGDCYDGCAKSHILQVVMRACCVHFDETGRDLVCDDLNLCVVRSGKRKSLCVLCVVCAQRTETGGLTRSLGEKHLSGDARVYKALRGLLGCAPGAGPPVTHTHTWHSRRRTPIYSQRYKQAGQRPFQFTAGYRARQSDSTRHNNATTH